jgi:hypothetical protein
MSDIEKMCSVSMYRDCGGGGVVCVERKTFYWECLGLILLSYLRFFYRPTHTSRAIQYGYMLHVSKMFLLHGVPFIWQLLL